MPPWVAYARYAQKGAAVAVYGAVRYGVCCEPTQLVGARRRQAAPVEAIRAALDALERDETALLEDEVAAYVVGP